MRMKIVRHLVSHVISLLVSTSLSLFQSTTTRSTTWTARPSPRRHCTLKHLFQNLCSRQAALVNRSRTSMTRVAETCEQTLPHLQGGREGRRGKRRSSPIQIPQSTEVGFFVVLARAGTTKPGQGESFPCRGGSGSCQLELPLVPRSYGASRVSCDDQRRGRRETQIEKQRRPSAMARCRFARRGSLPVDRYLLKDLCRPREHVGRVESVPTRKYRNDNKPRVGHTE